MYQEFFSTSIEHILAELERVDLLIKLHVLQAQRVYQNKAEFQGLFISEQEVERLLKQPIGRPIWVNVEKGSSFAKSRTILSQMADAIAKRKEESLKRGVSLRLEELSRRFYLSPLDVDILLICLAPELDCKYERLFSYLQDDITRKKPSVYLVSNLLSSSFENKLASRNHFDPESPLFKLAVLSIFDEPQQQNSPLYSKLLKLDDRLVSYLLGGNRIDSRLRSSTRLIEPDIQFKNLVLPADLVGHILFLSTKKYNQNGGPIFYFKGPYGVGKQSAAEATCRQLGKRLLRIEGDHLINSEGLSFEDKLTLVLRESKLQNAAIYWKGFDALLSEDKRTMLGFLLKALEEHSGLTFLSGEAGWEPRDALHQRTFAPIVFSVPAFGERLELWQRSLNGNTAISSDLDMYSLSNKFILSGGQIRDIVATAKNHALKKKSENANLNMKTLYAACRAHSNQKLSELSKKIKPKFTWTDIVLPQDKLALLNEIINHVKYKQKVYFDWGFEEKMSLGKGLTVLFSGPSGTGKTMAAEIIAGELDLDIYKIDLSLIVSKYIGETEKNLSKIFAEAETSNAILFFDEADALFGKRSEVKDSHDRYANIEIAYLLQKMEEYEGITILASNLRKNLDDAFVRRIKFIIEFPIPDEPHRYQIWQVHLPKRAPIEEDLDFDFLARNFKLTGGNIKNSVLHAAFLSASEESAINMKHIIQGIQREFQKAGKVCVKGDFGRYFELLSGNS